MEVNEKLILLDDFKDMDKLFIASDIFLLPTTNKTFNTNILKAMYCKCAVFTTIINDASELVDVFSTMESPQDRSMQFKLDALLHNKDELETIKQQNYDVAKEYTLEKQLKKIRRIIHI
jgi:glycosyltransferase involved in cell wall biosynthesis